MTDGGAPRHASSAIVEISAEDVKAVAVLAAGILPAFLGPFVALPVFHASWHFYRRTRP